MYRCVKSAKSLSVLRNFQCRGVLLIPIEEGQGPAVLAADVGWGLFLIALVLCVLSFHFLFFSLSGRRLDID